MVGVFGLVFIVIGIAVVIFCVKTIVDGMKRGGWQETPWGRIGVGLLLAQGVYYGLWNLGNAGLLAANPELAAAF